MNLDDEWEQFENCDYNFNNVEISKNIKKNNNTFPKASELYISTKTKIAHFNQSFDLVNLFWKIPIIKYQERKEGIIKKQIKINLFTKEDADKLNKIINNNKKDYLYFNQILKIDESRKTKFKDIRKINIGLSSKDLLTLKKKKSGAFYNCFVVIVRIKINDIYKEINIKLFNTGKLEIPGIQDDDNLYQALNLFIKIIQPYIDKKIIYSRNKVRNVLINSNFTCNFFINRNILYNILKNKYNIDVIYDPCSYPGIQCKYYYNETNINNQGICKCKKKCKKKDGICREISFMIFRTGSILIVGNCSEKVVYIIYNFINNILKQEYDKIYIPGKFIKKIKKKISKKRKIIITK